MDLTVICPVYNTPPEFIEQAVRSVLMQTASNKIEIIIIDDSSNNLDTLSTLKKLSYKYSEIRLIEQRPNGGPSKARNLGLDLASSEWIGFIDSDDVWPEGCLERANVIISQKPDTQWICGNYALLKSDGIVYPSTHIFEKTSMVDNESLSRRFESPELMRTLVGKWSPLGSCFVRCDLIKSVGGFNSDLVYGEDWLIFLKMSAISPMDYIDSESYILRRQGLSMMRSSRRMSSELLKAGVIAKQDPALKIIRRQLRWNHYALCKDIAMNNCLNGRKIKGLIYAIRAFLIDPREIGEMVYFIKSIVKKESERGLFLAGYSSAEQVILSNLESP